MRRREERKSTMVLRVVAPLFPPVISTKPQQPSSPQTVTRTTAASADAFPVSSSIIIITVLWFCFYVPVIKSTVVGSNPRPSVPGTSVICEGCDDEFQIRVGSGM
ncbi:hypothetical protein Salat_0946600 [Sesamum alatum]|uniref:Transmembrane protein n=1 Tax=Sesamum alatum TaxID=300844 RepID=A0AAE1YKC6_9LAMI|nr:hypothetical protein Salat_0946600 [Sesamum alatum]